MDSTKRKPINTITRIDQYEILYKMAGDALISVYRARDDQGRAVMIKIFNRVVSAHSADFIRFQSEVDKAVRMDNPSIVRVYSGGIFDGFPYIAAEYIDGHTLDAVLSDGKARSLDESLRIIMPIARALAESHSRNIVHRSLSPHAVIRAVADAMIKVSDFCLGRLFSESELRESADTLVYCSPERSGLTGAVVDPRSDLYSLGAIFYELLVGCPPFESADDSARLLRQIDSQVPVFPSVGVASFPPVVGCIVGKLLEKRPERRYQNALTLIRDLDRVRSGDYDFTPSAAEETIQLSLYGGLVARDREYERVHSRYKAACAGQGSLCLVNGEPGCGKTRLLEEIKKSANADGRMVIGGLADNDDYAAPYGPFVAALSAYVRCFTEYPEQKKMSVSLSLRKEFSTLGGLLVRMNPLLRSILGDCPPLVPLEDAAEHVRFITVAAQFFLVLSKIERGLVLLLDDMHRADTGSIALLASIAEKIRDSHLLLVWAGSAQANLAERLPVIPADHDESMGTIMLDPLDAAATEEMVSALLCSETSVAPIAEFVYGKSAGNPFLVTEILRILIAEKAILYRDGSWHIDIDRISKTGLTSSPDLIVSRRLAFLGDDARQLCSMMSPLGMEVSCSLLLALAAETPGPERSIALVDELLQAGIFRVFADDDLFRFAHPLYREAFAVTDANADAALQERIVERYETVFAGRSEEVLFAVARHAIRSGNREKILAWSSRAAVAAHDLTAFAESAAYHEIAAHMIDQQGGLASPEWMSSQESRLSALLALGQADAAIALAQAIPVSRKDHIRLARIQVALCRAYAIKQEWAACEASGKSALALLGEHMPGSGLQLAYGPVERAIFRVRAAVGGHEPEAGDRRAAYGMIVEIYHLLSDCFLHFNKQKYGRSIIRAYQVANAKLEPSPPVCRAGLRLGQLLIERKSFARSLRILEKSRQMADALGDPLCLAESFAALGAWYAATGDQEAAWRHNEMAAELFQSIGAFDAARRAREAVHAQKPSVTEHHGAPAKALEIAPVSAPLGTDALSEITKEPETAAEQSQSSPACEMPHEDIHEETKIAPQPISEPALPKTLPPVDDEVRSLPAPVVKTGPPLYAILDLETLIREIVSRGVQVAGVRRAFLFLRDEGGKVIRLRGYKSTSHETSKHYSKSLVRHVFETGLPAFGDDENVDDAFGVGSSRENGPLLGIPLLHNKRTIGVFYADAGVDVFDRRHIAMLSETMEQATVALENAAAVARLVRQTQWARLYAAPEVMERIFKHNEEPRSGGIEAAKAILVSDIRDFSLVFERLGGRNAIDWLNAYYEFIRPTIKINFGAIDSFKEDTIVISFDRWTDAVRCAIDMRNDRVRFNAKQPDIMLPNGPCKPLLDMGIGISGGTLLQGNIGNGDRYDFRVMGRPAFIATRLQALTKRYRSPILIDGEVRRWIADEISSKPILVRCIDRVHLNGHIGAGASEDIFEVINADDPAIFELKLANMTRFVEAMDLYLTPGPVADRIDQWTRAAEIFESINKDCREKLPVEKYVEGQGDYIAFMLQQRLASMIKNPPEQWDGVFHDATTLMGAE